MNTTATLASITGMAKAVTLAMRAENTKIFDAWTIHVTGTTMYLMNNYMGHVVYPEIPFEAILNFNEEGTTPSIVIHIKGRWAMVNNSKDIAKAIQRQVNKAITGAGNFLIGDKLDLD